MNITTATGRGSSSVKSIPSGRITPAPPTIPPNSPVSPVRHAGGNHARTARYAIAPSIPRMAVTMTRNNVNLLNTPIVNPSSVSLPCSDGAEVSRSTNIASRPPRPPIRPPIAKPAMTAFETRPARFVKSCCQVRGVPTPEVWCRPRSRSSGTPPGRRVVAPPSPERGGVLPQGLFQRPAHQHL